MITTSAPALVVRGFLAIGGCFPFRARGVTTSLCSEHKRKKSHCFSLVNLNLNKSEACPEASWGGGGDAVVASGQEMLFNVYIVDHDRDPLGRSSDAQLLSRDNYRPSHATNGEKYENEESWILTD